MNIKNSIQSICVFCGSNPGLNPAYKQAAILVGQILAKHNIMLVYGAGSVGLMGIMADACLKAGGKVTGVIPQFLMDKEVGHKGLTNLILTENMHQRKQKMADLSDAFITLPGGTGTLEELFEVFTWAQLGLHEKPIGILNVENYYDGLITFLDHSTNQRFLSESNREMMLVDNDCSKLIDKLKNYDPPQLEKWLDRALV